MHTYEDLSCSILTPSDHLPDYIINNYKVPILGLICNTINFVINLFGLVYRWSLYTYSRKLITESCECSNKKSGYCVDFLLDCYFYILYIDGKTI